MSSRSLLPAIAIVVALAMLLAWILLAALSESVHIDKTSRVPTPPQITPVYFEPHEPRSASSQAVPVRELFNPDTLKEFDEDGPAMGLDNDSLPLVWLLEVFKVEELEMAKRLLSDLRGAGHKAFIHIADEGEYTSYFLYIGPKVDRRRIEEEKSVIDKMFNVDARILRFMR